MNKKVAFIFAVIAVLAGIGLFVFGGKDTPVTTPTSTPVPTSTPTPTSAPTSQPTTEKEFTISTFTAEVEYYKSINSIPEADKIPEDSLSGLYNHLKGIAKIDPNLVENEDNEYFAGYLEWYNTPDEVTGLGTVESVEVPKDTTEVKKNANGGVDVPKDQVLAYIGDTYGKEALDITQEAIRYDVVTESVVQQSLAMFDQDYMKKVIDSWPSGIESKKRGEERIKQWLEHDGAAEVQAYANGQQ